MRLRKHYVSVEACVFVGCFLIVFVSITQIIVFSHKVRAPDASQLIAKRGLSDDDGRTEPSRKRRVVVGGAQARSRARARAQQEVRQLEKSLAKLMRETVLSPDQSNAKLQNELYARRIGDIIHQAEEGSLAPMNGSRLRQPGPSPGQIQGSGERSAQVSDQGGRNEKRPVPYPSSKFGLPLNYQKETPHSGQEIANAAQKSNPRPLKHFKDFDRSEEYELKNVISTSQNYGEENISTEYEDNYNKVKKEFMDGTELYVDEEKLKILSGSGLDVCPREPDSLVGNTTEVNLNITLDIDEIIEGNSDVLPGGEWKPSSCISRHRMAIIIPYRDRWNHLKVLLHYLIPTLKRQQIHFRIFVVEQHGNETFNKGRIMNAAFREGLKLFDFQCVTFHDVDLVPEDDRNMYSCTEQPKHMSLSIDKFEYHLPYQGLVGGVLMFKTEHFQLVNGYSNMYWGWGAEDDDMTTRILHRGLRIYRPPSNIARYKMVKHDGRESSEVAVRMKLLRSAARRSKMEGLNNVQYKLLTTHEEKLFTHFIVDIGRP